MRLFGRVKSDCVLFRAIIVTLTLMSISFSSTAYYHYTTNAATDYACGDYGSPECNSMSLEERFKMLEPGGTKYISSYMDRLLISGASIHINRSYLLEKYPALFIKSEGNYLNLSGNDEQSIKQRKEYHSEVSSMKARINKYYESSYIEEALVFAGKWTLLLPLSLVALLCAVLGTKNYILLGRIRAAR